MLQTPSHIWTRYSGWLIGEQIEEIPRGLTVAIVTAGYSRLRPQSQIKLFSEVSQMYITSV